MSYLLLSTQVPLAILPKVSGMMSCVGSLWIITEVCGDRKKRALIYHRLLLGMSSGDLCSSFFWFLSSWCVPRGTWWGAAGNIHTCELQAFFVMFGTTTVLYNASLALYYLLVIRSGWREKRIRKTAEPWFHGVPVTTGAGFAVAGLALNLYNPSGPVCGIVASPPWCKQSYQNGGQTDCIRGDNAGLYEIPFTTVWWCLSLVIVTVSMITVYTVIRRTETASGRYGTGEVNRSNSREFANQGMLYVAALYLTYLFMIVGMVYRSLGKMMPFPIVCLASFFFPLQGFFNFLVYIRPRYRKYRKKFPSLSAVQVTKKVLRRPFTKCLGGGNEEDGDERLGAKMSQTATTESRRSATAVSN